MGNGAAICAYPHVEIWASKLLELLGAVAHEMLERDSAQVFIMDAMSPTRPRDAVVEPS